jgi:hypothetical protein
MAGLRSLYEIKSQGFGSFDYLSEVTRGLHPPRGRMSMDLSTNLAPVRGPSVWSRAEFSGAAPYPVSRLLIAGAGIGFLLAAFTGRTPRRGLLACSGASLLALAGSRTALRGVRDWVKDRLAVWERDDAVNEASELSFPASDSPSWTSSVGSGAPEDRQRR